MLQGRARCTLNHISACPYGRLKAGMSGSSQGMSGALTVSTATLVMVLSCFAKLLLRRPRPKIVPEPEFHSSTLPSKRKGANSLHASAKLAWSNTK
jgi:hypothetical protein